MSEETLIQRIVLDEITGKNQAIHAYDRMIWTIRTGFLTLFFAGWGILLKSLVDSSSHIKNLGLIMFAMLMVSIAISIAGFILDRNYTRRKFRVILALDTLLSIILQKGNVILNNPLELEEIINVSGDKDNNNYIKVSGYEDALKAAKIIYCTPLAATLVCVVLFILLGAEN
jgi:positive regulator of sigma E activity